MHSMLNGTNLFGGPNKPEMKKNDEFKEGDQTSIQQVFIYFI